MNPFEPVLARIRAVQFPDPDDCDGELMLGLDVAPPASAELRAKILVWAGGRMPAELDAFLSLTAGFSGHGLCVDLAHGGSGATGVFEVYDYGNGDVLGLDAEGDRCAVWWIGHDPYGVIFVADSLLAYLTAFADLAERGEIDDLQPIKPDRDLTAVTPAVARVAGDDPNLRDLPAGALVYDFRGAAPRTHVDHIDVPRGYDLERHGRLVIATRRA